MRTSIEQIKNGYLLNVECWDMAMPDQNAILYDALLKKAAVIREAEADPEMAKIRAEENPEEMLSIQEEVSMQRMQAEAQNPSGTYAFATYEEAIDKAKEIFAGHKGSATGRGRRSGMISGPIM